MTLLHSKGHCWILHEQCSNAIIQQPDIPSQITAQPNYCIYNAAIWGLFLPVAVCGSGCLGRLFGASVALLFGPKCLLVLMFALCAGCLGGWCMSGM
jgi:hypothetical protein